MLIKSIKDIPQPFRRYSQFAGEAMGQAMDGETRMEPEDEDVLFVLLLFLLFY